MWEIDNNTPFAVERAFARDRAGGEVLLVVAAATFMVEPGGKLRVAEDQEPPERAPVWTGDPAGSSLRHDSDFVLKKRGTDVLMHGHAHAPGGRPVPSLDVGLTVGRLNKRLRVHGTRVWMRSHTSAALEPGPAMPFDRVPLVYERAFGGADPDAPAGKPARSGGNPVGRGFAHDPEALINREAPQLELGGAPLRAGPFEAPPAGFGPIAPGWSPRSAFAGTYDGAWETRRAPLLPDDFDERFFQSAPEDQQVPGFLRGGEPIQAVNVTASGRFATVVPDVQIQVRAIFTDGEENALGSMHTLMLLPDDSQVRIVWHAAVPCDRREHKLRNAIVNWEGDRSCLSR